jgi:hypothetical protein
MATWFIVWTRCVRHGQRSIERYWLRKYSLYDVWLVEPGKVTDETSREMFMVGRESLPTMW